MITWLHQLPDVAVFLLITLPLVILTVAASLLFGNPKPKAGGDEDGFQIMDAFIAVASVAAVVLGFSLVEVDSTLRTVEDNVAKEASAINNLDRAIIRYGDTRLDQVHETLLSYAKLVETREWQQMQRGQRSPEVDTLYDSISDGLRAMEPGTEHQTTMYKEALQSVDSMADLRELRLEAAKVGLPSLFWETVIFLFAMLVLIASQTEPTHKRLVAIGSVTATLGILLSLIVILDAPFEGDSPVSADEINAVIASMAVRQP